MLMHFDSERPVFLQVAEKMEDAILTGAFEEEQQVPSTTELSVSCKINPATALKGINLLVEDGILYKKRGVGMFVCTGAVEKIRSKRRMAFLHQPAGGTFGGGAKAWDHQTRGHSPSLKPDFPSGRTNHNQPSERNVYDAHHCH